MYELLPLYRKVFRAEGRGSIYYGCYYSKACTIIQGVSHLDYSLFSSLWPGGKFCRITTDTSRFRNCLYPQIPKQHAYWTVNQACIDKQIELSVNITRWAYFIQTILNKYWTIEYYLHYVLSVRTLYTATVPLIFCIYEKNILFTVKIYMVDYMQYCTCIIVTIKKMETLFTLY